MTENWLKFDRKIFTTTNLILFIKVCCSHGLVIFIRSSWFSQVNLPSVGHLWFSQVNLPSVGHLFDHLLWSIFHSLFTLYELLYTNHISEPRVKSHSNLFKNILPCRDLNPGPAMDPIPVWSRWQTNMPPCFGLLWF